MMFGLIVKIYMRSKEIIVLRETRFHFKSLHLNEFCKQNQTLTS